MGLPTTSVLRSSSQTANPQMQPTGRPVLMRKPLGHTPSTASREPSLAVLHMHWVARGESLQRGWLWISGILDLPSRYESRHAMGCGALGSKAHLSGLLEREDVEQDLPLQVGATSGRVFKAPGCRSNQAIAWLLKNGSRAPDSMPRAARARRVSGKLASSC